MAEFSIDDDGDLPTPAPPISEAHSSSVAAASSGAVAPAAVVAPEGAGEDAPFSTPEPPQESAEADEQWLSHLATELDNSFADVETIRKILSGHKVPSELRPKIWKIALSVASKPDVLSGQRATTSDDSHLRRSCRTAAERFCEASTLDAVAEEMEIILTFFTRARGSDYDSAAAWPELLAPFFTLSLSRGDRYNCFYSLMSRYVFRAVSPTASTYAVFRLLLLYHDPELCNALDSRRIGPEIYAAGWLRSLFASAATPAVTTALWDSIFLTGDPMIMLYLALVILVNAREVVLQGDDDIPATLTGIPAALSVDDVEDLISIAEHYSAQTPQAFRTTFHAELFLGPTRAPGKSTVSAKTALCLPISVETLLDARSRDGAIKYFIVDCRTQAEYDAGHLTHAWHLDVQLMFENPSLFKQEVKKLEEAVDATMHHPCFLGAGPVDRDPHVGMVVSHFLQRHQKYVSVAHGGFEALHCLLDALTTTASVLDGHAPARCSVCIAQDPASRRESEQQRAGPAGSNGGVSGGLAPFTAAAGSAGAGAKAVDGTQGGDATKPGSKPASPRLSLLRRALSQDPDKEKEKEKEKEKDKEKAAGDEKPSAVSAKLTEWASLWKEKKDSAAALLKEKSAQYSASLKEKSKVLKEKIKEKTDNFRKDTANAPYRSQDIPTMFSIDDDDEESEAVVAGPVRGSGVEADLGSAVLRHTTKGQYTVDLSLLRDQPNIKHVFVCNEVYTDGFMYPSHLAFTATHILKLRELRVGRDEAVFLSRRPLRSVTKITAKKKHPNLVTLVFEEDGTHEDMSSLFGSAVANVIEGEGLAGTEKRFIMERFMIPEAEAAKDALKTLVGSLRA